MQSDCFHSNYHWFASWNMFLPEPSSHPGPGSNWGDMSLNLSLLLFSSLGRLISTSSPNWTPRENSDSSPLALCLHSHACLQTEHPSLPNPLPDHLCLVTLHNPTGDFQIPCLLFPRSLPTLSLPSTTQAFAIVFLR